MITLTRSVGVIRFSPAHPDALMTRIEGATLSPEKFEEVMHRFKQAFPDARWISSLPGCWLLPKESIDAVRSFYIGVFGAQGYRLEGSDGYRQLFLF